MDVEVETASITLRRLVAGDAADLFLLSNEPTFRQWLPSQVYADEAEARAALDFLASQCAAPANPKLGPYVLAIEHRVDRRLIGHVGLSPIGSDVEIGFAIAEAYQRRGLAAEAVVAACRWAFERFELSMILGIAAQRNEASMRVLLRAGFEHEEDRVMCFQGTEQAVAVYGLSRRPLRRGEA